MNLKNAKRLVEALALVGGLVLVLLVAGVATRTSDHKAVVYSTTVPPAAFNVEVGTYVTVEASGETTYQLPRENRCIYTNRLQDGELNQAFDSNSMRELKMHAGDRVHCWKRTQGGL